MHHASLPLRPLALLATAAVAAALLVALAVAVPSASADFPSGTKPSFMRTCVPTAKKSSNGQFSRRQARIYCATSYRCLERRISFRQFQRLGSATGKLKRIRDRCTERGAKAALS